MPSDHRLQRRPIHANAITRHEPEERAIDLHTRYRHDIGACSPLFVSEKFVLETSLTLIGHATNPDRELGTVHRSKVQNEDLNS